jgi:hypothetical protein
MGKARQLGGRKARHLKRCPSRLDNRRRLMAGRRGCLYEEGLAGFLFEQAKVGESAADVTSDAIDLGSARPIFVEIAGEQAGERIKRR